jgi:hypothetical protein
MLSTENRAPLVRSEKVELFFLDIEHSHPATTPVRIYEEMLVLSVIWVQLLLSIILQDFELYFHFISGNRGKNSL